MLPKPFGYRSSPLPIPVLAASPRRLQVFVAVVELGGFSAAAQSLGISQPSVSAHVRALEEIAGTPLFGRVSGTAPRLTEPGRLLYDYAREAVQRAQEIKDRLGRLPRTLRFAAQRFAATSLLAHPLEAFAAANPGIDLIARTGTYEEVRALFLSGEVDLVFLLSDGEVPGMRTEAMGKYRLAFIAAPDHPLAGRTAIPIDEVARHPFVMARSGSFFGRTIGNLLLKGGFKSLPQGSQAEEFAVVRDLVRAGIGISVSLRRSVQNELAAGTLVELDVDMDPMYLVLHCASQPTPLQPEIGQLIDLVRRNEGRVHAVVASGA